VCLEQSHKRWIARLCAYMCVVKRRNTTRGDSTLSLVLAVLLDGY